MARQAQKRTMEEFKRQEFIRQLKTLGVTEVAGNGLHNLDAQELKWHLALQLAKKEL